MSPDPLGGRLFDHDPYYDAGADPYQAWNLAPGLDPAEVSDTELWDWGLAGGGSSSSTQVTGAPDQTFAVGGWSS